MLVIRDSSEIYQLADPEVRDLIRRRMEEFAPDDDLVTTFLVVEPGDAPGALDAELGFPVLADRADGPRFGDPRFSPSFELVAEHGRWYELVFILSDDGSGAEVFVPKAHGVDPDLLRLCAAYAEPAVS